jgi:hypothetical protein
MWTSSLSSQQIDALILDSICEPLYESMVHKFVETNGDGYDETMLKLSRERSVTLFQPHLSLHLFFLLHFPLLVVL